jgi:hypothetical protein
VAEIGCNVHVVLLDLYLLLTCCILLGFPRDPLFSVRFADIAVLPSSDLPSQLLSQGVTSEIPVMITTKARGVKNRPSAKSEEHQNRYV